MCGIKIPLKDFALKRQGGGGVYLRDITVLVFLPHFLNERH